MKYEKINDNYLKLAMDEKYLDKKYCQECAKKIISEYGWEMISEMELAKEIYGHAFIFYKGSILKNIPGLKEKVFDHVADGIDVENKLDKRQGAFEMIWKL